jgi:hypothetical protein
MCTKTLAAFGLLVMTVSVSVCAKVRAEASAGTDKPPR